MGHQQGRVPDVSTLRLLMPAHLCATIARTCRLSMTRSRWSASSRRTRTSSVSSQAQHSGACWHTSPPVLPLLPTLSVQAYQRQSTGTQPEQWQAARHRWQARHADLRRTLMRTACAGSLHHRAAIQIPYEELDVQDQIGGGGFALVYRGMWQGTPVAIKKWFDPNITDELYQEFREEVMTLQVRSSP